MFLGDFFTTLDFCTKKSPQKSCGERKSVNGQGTVGFCRENVGKLHQHVVAAAGIVRNRGRRPERGATVAADRQREQCGGTVSGRSEEENAVVQLGKASHQP